MKLNTLNIKLKEKKKRLGRGIGSSKGKTSGRGVQNDPRGLIFEELLGDFWFTLPSLWHPQGPKVETGPLRE